MHNKKDFCKAIDGTRTRGFLLGKEVLYQLSHYRILFSFIIINMNILFLYSFVNFYQHSLFLFSLVTSAIISYSYCHLSASTHMLVFHYEVAYNSLISTLNTYFIKNLHNLFNCNRGFFFSLFI